MTFTNKDTTLSTMAETHSQTSQTETQQGTKRDHDSFSELEKLETPFTADSQFVRGFETQAMEGVEVRSQEHHTVEDSDNVLQSNHPRPAVNVEESGKVKEASNQPTAPAEELIYGKPVATKLDTECQSQSSIPTPSVDCKTEGNPLQPSSRRSSSASLTDVASATPSLRGSPPPSTATPAPSAFAALDGNGPPPKKQRIREKLTFAEKEAKRIEKEFLEQERAAEKARKDAERESKRKKIELEREEKRIALEAAKEERRRIEMEREEKRVALEAAKEERRRKKEEEKKAKEEEKQRAEEEKRKKERSQKTLGSFFAIPAPTVRQKSIEGRSSMSPAPTNTPLAAPTTSPGASSPTKKQVSAYDKLFPAFFVQQNVTVAPINRFERDEEASEALQNIIDSYLLEGQSSEYHLSFNAVDLFHLSGITNIPRGRRLMTVRDIMTEFSGNPSRPIDLTSDSQNTQIKKTVDLLRRIPMKSLKFQQDVRPAYIGTFTTQPLHGLQRLARNPLRKDHPTTDYDYDSEAEWVEDEDAEDLESDGEEEDVEMVDAGEDLEGFLDDEGDETALARRHPLQATAEEPVSSGLCWEDNHKRNTNVKMMPYRMEFILGKLHTCTKE